MITNKLLAVAALLMLGTVTAAGLALAADSPKAAKSNCAYIVEGDQVCPGAGAVYGDMQAPTPGRFEGQGSSD